MSKDKDISLATRVRINARRSRGAFLLIVSGSLLADGCAPGVPSASCTTLGIDVSRHQGLIDWRAVAATGVRFVWIKATEGGDYRDPLFRRNWDLAPAAGLRRGAYHFVYWCRRAEEQAAWFITNVPKDPTALPPVLDVEWNPGSRTCPGEVPREKAVADVKIMLEAMEHAYGVRPLIYAPADLYAEVLAGAFDARDLWARDLDGTPDASYAGRSWQVWQYSETGRIAGIAADVDLDCVRTGTPLMAAIVRRR